jgi:hypothetical protein
VAPPDWHCARLRRSHRGKRNGSTDDEIGRRADTSSRYGANAVLRTAVVTSDTSGYLWTRGYIPRPSGSGSAESVDRGIRQGTADIGQVMNDVMSLTVLNFNGAEYCDGLPVTLRFADLVWEILTAGPITPTLRCPSNSKSAATASWLPYRRRHLSMRDADPRDS